jgi:tripartite-type tricarboxylate transporter receptor subunit TctC
MHFFRIAFAVLTLAFAAGAAAQDWPARPVKIVVPYGAGSAPDVIARTIADEIAPRLGQPVIIENRVGAGGKIGTEAVAKSAPDGYTLLLGSKDTHGVMEHLYPGWEVKPLRDLAPVSLLIRIQNAVVANKDLGAAGPRELIALAKTQNLNFGTPGVGTNLHLLGEYLAQQHGLRFTHVPFKQFSEILPSVMRGEVQLAVLGVPPVTPLVRDGRIRAIAVTGTARSPYLPEVPTFAEAGLAGFESGGWFALFAPAATPAAVVRRLNAEVVEAGRRATYQDRARKMFSEPATSTPEELAQLAAKETARWGEVVKKAGIRLN